MLVETLILWYSLFHTDLYSYLARVSVLQYIRTWVHV
jgi:hypothetical protein